MSQICCPRPYGRFAAGFLSGRPWLFATSSAYLFTTGSAPVPSDGEVSWGNYSPWHLSQGFIPYALPLTGLLPPAFGSDCRCKRRPRFILRLYSAAYLMASLRTTCQELRIYHIPGRLIVGSITVWPLPARVIANEATRKPPDYLSVTFFNKCFSENQSQNCHNHNHNHRTTYKNHSNSAQTHH